MTQIDFNQVTLFTIFLIAYANFLNIIRNIFKESNILDPEYNLKVVNEYWIHKYLKFNDIKENFS